MMSIMNESLESFLQKQEGKKTLRCICCSNPDLVKDLQKYLEGRASGEISISVHRLHTDYVRPKYGVKAVNSLYRHLRVCEGADV